MRIKYLVSDGKGRTRVGTAEPHTGGCVTFDGDKPRISPTHEKLGWSLVSWEDITPVPQTLEEAMAKVKGSDAHKELQAALGGDSSPKVDDEDTKPRAKPTAAERAAKRKKRRVVG